jgi:hypothetical protein
MFSQKVVIGLTANSSISQMPNNATSIGSSAGSVICQLPNNATAIGATSLNSNTQISFSGEPVGKGPVGVTSDAIEVIGATGTTSESTVVVEEHLVNNTCCSKWR